MHAESAAALPPKIVRADRFIPSLSAYAVDLVLRRKELQATRARLLAAEYLLDMYERRLFRELGYSSVMHYGTHALGLSPRDVWDRLRVARALRQLPGGGCGPAKRAAVVVEAARDHPGGNAGDGARMAGTGRPIVVPGAGGSGCGGE